jgi:integrase
MLPGTVSTSVTPRATKIASCSFPSPRWLFPAKPGPRGGHATKPLDRATAQRAFALAVAEANIHKKVSIHSLRHSYATHLIEAGVSLIGVQHQLGHADPRTTVRYVRMTDAARTEHAGLINQLIDALAEHVREQRARVAS